MATLAQRLLSRGKTEQRHDVSISSVDDFFTFLGSSYPFGVNTSWTRGPEVPPPSDYAGYAGMFTSDPVVFAAVAFRLEVFSQGRFQWRELLNGRPQAPFGNEALRLLERPWFGGRTSDLLAQMLVYGDIAGNAYPLKVDNGRGLSLLRPDWVTLVLGSNLDPEDPGTAEDAELIAIAYSPGGKLGKGSRVYLPGEFAHYAPYPDPMVRYRGMSPLTPIVREVQGDKAATEHKLKFFQHGATPNMVIKHDPSMTAEQVKAFKALFDEEHQGLANAYKTLHLGGGADATVVGANLQQIDFKSTQGKSETRILMALGVHPTLVGASEGMQGSSLNAGNYSQTRRAFSDVKLQHLWGEACGALEVLLPRPSDSAHLVIDQRDIPFLQDDQKDKAEIQNHQANAMRTLVDGGFEPDSVRDAVLADDYSLLKHTGKLSVQLQEPGTDPDAAPSTEGDDA
ncbi:MAG TPA: phage portal protein [Egibacteraceae bacterium]|nr:phage portal protein [Egibacteraceae bacterium]